MRALLLYLLVATLSPLRTEGQIAVELTYGFDRNVESSEPELDGWLNGTVEWMLPSGLGIGVGTDHQFESAAVSPGDFLGWAVYASTSYEVPMGPAAPFLRGGIGLGRTPCEGDVCRGGAYLRGSAGLRIRVGERLRVSGEVGLSRVSRPFGGAGLSVRF